MKKSERMELAKWTANRAVKCGADETAVTISNSRDIETEIRDRKLEKLKESTQNSLSLTVYRDKRYSSHSTCDLKKDSLETFIREAVAGTGYLAQDPFRSLPDPRYYPGKSKRDLKILDPKYGEVESADRIRMAAEAEAAASGESEKIISTTAGYSDSLAESVTIHSNGFAGESEETYYSIYASVSVKENGARPSDYAYAASRFYGELPSPAAIGKEAAARTLSAIGQRKIASGKYDMLVENRVGGRILSMLQGPMSGRALQQKSSCLEGKLGQQVASELFSLTDDPFLEKGLGSQVYDGEGMAAKKRVVIEKGILNCYYINYYYSRKLGVEPTTGGPANILLETGADSMKELMKRIQKGILVTAFIGGNSNPATGDFSFGVVGQYIENGEAVQPVNEMNISGNMLDLMKQLAAIGNDPFAYSSVRTPSLLFEKVQFSGL